MDVSSYLLGKKNGGGGTTPTGSINITENGEHNVTNYATANVNVIGGDTIQETNATLNKFVENLINIPQTYIPYYQDNTTLYTPDSNYKAYLIIRDTAGTAQYRIFWLYTNTILARTGNTSVYQYQISITTPTNFDYGSWNNQLIETYNSRVNQYRSTNYYATIQECIEAIKNNSTTYQSSTSSIGYRGGEIISNAIIRDLYDQTQEYIPAQKISSNETIQVIE